MCLENSIFKYEFMNEQVMNVFMNKQVANVQ